MQIGLSEAKMVGDLVPDDSANALSDLVIAATHPLDGTLVDEYAVGQRQIIGRPPCAGNADVKTQEHRARRNARRP